MSEIPLEQQIEKLPKPDATFMLGDLVAGRNYLGLRYTGGLYIMKDVATAEIVYVGISKEVGARLKNHVNNFKDYKPYYNPNLIYKLITKFGMTLEDAQSYLKGLEISVFLEDRANYREHLEKYIIKKYNPKYNIYHVDDDRAGAAHRIYTVNLPIDNIIQEYLAGDSSTVLAKRYDVSTGTILKRLRDAGVVRDLKSASKIRWHEKQE